MSSELYRCAGSGNLGMVKRLVEGGANIERTDNKGNTVLLGAASYKCNPTIHVVEWLLEYGGADITHTNNDGDSVWTVHHESRSSLGGLLIGAYAKNKDNKYYTRGGEYVTQLSKAGYLTGRPLKLTAMLRVMVLHGAPPESLVSNLAPPFQRIVKDGARLRARLPAYLTQRRALVDAHCPLPPPLLALVHGYAEPTNDELWATGLGAYNYRQRATVSHSPDRRSDRLLQRRL
jgi:hypothetical protein